MEGGVCARLTKLVGPFPGVKDADRPIASVNCINEAKAAGQLTGFSGQLGISQKPRRHTRPDAEDAKRKQVAQRQRSTSGFVEFGPKNLVV